MRAEPPKRRKIPRLPDSKVMSVRRRLREIKGIIKGAQELLAFMPRGKDPTKGEKKRLRCLKHELSSLQIRDPKEFWRRENDQSCFGTNCLSKN